MLKYIYKIGRSTFFGAILHRKFITHMKLNDLLKYDDIVIQCHDFPDADTVASGFGVYRYLAANEKNVRLIYSGAQKISKPNMLIMTEKLEIPLEYVSSLDYEPQLLVTVDCIFGESNVRRLNARNIAVIDHHICGGSLPELSEVRSNYGSCSTIIAKMLEDEGFNIFADEKLSTALYYGLFMDTNAFSEIGHPADKDLRDFGIFDRQLITTLRNSNLTYQEMEIAGEALNHCNYYPEFNLAIVEARPCDPNILGFISDLLLQVNTVDHCIVYCRLNAGCKFSVRSCTNKINAAGLAKYITANVGNGGGHISKAGGFISASLMTDKDISSYIESRLLSYHKETDIIYSGTNAVDTSDMNKYVKKKIILGYVPSTDIVAPGAEIMIRMLEGDIYVKADKNIYLMTGISGEVYPINKAVFEKSYDRTETLPEMDYEYPPIVIEKSTGCAASLEPYIKGCVSSEEVCIFARELTRNTKVFTEWDKNSYIYGIAGDYLASRDADGKDVYIIKRDIFSRLYRPSEK